MSAIEVSRINRVINQTRFLFVLAMHPFQPAFFAEPSTDQIDYINAPRVWRVVERLVLNVRSIVEHGMKSIGYSLQQIVPKNDDGNTAWSHVFLRARVNHRVFFDGYRMGK